MAEKPKVKRNTFFLKFALFLFTITAAGLIFGKLANYD